MKNTNNNIRGRKVNALFSEEIEKESQKGTLGLISMILGVFGLLFSFCCTFMAVIPGLTALVCGVIAHNQGQKYGISGIVFGILTVAAGIILTYLGMQ